MLRNTLYRLSDVANQTIAPSLKYSQLLYEDEISCRLKHDITWLDLGCGHHILPPWRQSQEQALVSGCQTVGAHPATRSTHTDALHTRARTPWPDVPASGGRLGAGNRRVWCL